MKMFKILKTKKMVYLVAKVVVFEIRRQVFAVKSRDGYYLIQRLTLLVDIFVPTVCSFVTMGYRAMQRKL